MWDLPRLRAGDRVRVRTPQEIFATLDENGAVDGMPFMPEMLQYCGRELTVDAVAHKTCDTANRTGGRKLDRTVHLTGSRCDGRAHGGCEAECNIFWKEAWLERLEGAGARAVTTRVAAPKSDFTEARLAECTRVPGQGPAGGQRTTSGQGAAAAGGVATAPGAAATGQGAVASTGSGPVRYRCQATQLFAASRPLPWWNGHQFLLDVRTGNARLGHVLRIVWLAAVYQLLRIPVGYRVWNGIYEWMHLRLIGRPSPHVVGRIPTGDPTPATALGLQPGEEVRIRPASEIAATLNRNNKNRGIWFGPEMTPYCGGTFRVRRRVTQIINESTGEMMEMKTPCITLDDVLCRGHYSDSRLFCPRLITPYWRELWLERVQRDSGTKPR